MLPAMPDYLIRHRYARVITTSYYATLRYAMPAMLPRDTLYGESYRYVELLRCCTDKELLHVPQRHADTPVMPCHAAIVIRHVAHSQLLICCHAAIRLRQGPIHVNMARLFRHDTLAASLLRHFDADYRHACRQLRCCCRRLIVALMPDTLPLLFFTPLSPRQTAPADITLLLLRCCRLLFFSLPLMLSFFTL